MIPATAAPKHESSLREIRYALRLVLVVLAVILIPATPAVANSVASWVWVWPGVVSIYPLFGLLPTLLVSFVERPFVCRAGVIERPLIRSIRANVLSLFGGIPVSMFVWNIRSEAGLYVLAGVAVAVSVLIEGIYFWLVLRKECRRLRWQWILFGNIVSSLLLLSISLSVRALNDLYPHLWNALPLPYGAIQLTAVGLCIVTAAVPPAEQWRPEFCWHTPRLGRRRWGYSE